MGALKAGCDRAREWVSLELDGELSELGAVRLDAHLVRCAACSAYARVVRAATDELRAAPVEPAPLEVSLAVARPRHALVRGLVPATALLAVVGALALGGSSPSPSGHTAKPPYFEQRLLTLARHTRGDVVIKS